MAFFVVLAIRDEVACELEGSHRCQIFLFSIYLTALWGSIKVISSLTLEGFNMGKFPDGCTVSHKASNQMLVVVKCYEAGGKVVYDCTDGIRREPVRFDEGELILQETPDTSEVWIKLKELEQRIEQLESK